MNCLILISGDLSVVDNEFQVLGHTNKEGVLVGIVVLHLAGRKEIWLPLEDLVVLVRDDFREDVMGHIDQAVHRFEEEYQIQIFMPVR